jgi:hypothetical protein
MASVASFGRKAYGHQRRMSPTTKAKNVAASIRQRIREHRPYSQADYGLVDGTAQAALVLALLDSEVAA